MAAEVEVTKLLIVYFVNYGILLQGIIFVAVGIPFLFQWV